MSEHKGWNPSTSADRLTELELRRIRPELGDPFAAAIRTTRMAMLITDPSLPDNPIIFANQAFAELTGYSLEEALGRNCRFLQGPDTSPEDRERIRACIEQEEDLHLEILNYRKDGTPFWNSLFISPVRDSAGRIAYFFGSQLDVSERKAQELEIRRLVEELAQAKRELETEVEQRTRALVDSLDAKTNLLTELDHRVKNNLQLMISLVNLEKRERASESERQALDVIGVRLQALGLVHRKLYNQESVGVLDVGGFVHQIAEELQSQSGRDDVRIEFAVETLMVSAAKAGPIALLLNELIAAAYRFAYQGRSGSLKLMLRVEETDEIVFSISDDTYTVLEKETAKASVGQIVSILARQLEAAIDWPAAEPRTLVMVTMPRAVTTAEVLLDD